MREKYLTYEVSEVRPGEFEGKIVEKNIGSLPYKGTFIRVYYSSLNYKDALSASGNKGVTRQYPFTPGVDAAGVIIKSDSPNFKKGDRVFVTGFDLGMNTHGGLGEYISVPAEWVFPLPDHISFAEVMMYGTAGLTAGLSTLKLIEENITSKKGNIVVSGASGGVGSLAVALLSFLGFPVTAVTGKEDFKKALQEIGAKEILPRSALNDTTKKPLLSAKWDGGIDTVGGTTLSTMLKMINRYGCIASCGNAGGYELNTTVFPFILRGITLAGIDSAECPDDRRKIVWDKLFNEWNILTIIKGINKEIPLDEVDTHLKLMLKGQNRGHIIVRHSD
jgi:putative YhdH/YhfP family quinone oxidoreductase